jgi:hypothetical protein
MHTRGSIPMAISNDNYYGYIASLLVTRQVTWLECAAASLFWSTILVYYLEKPYGHLMLEGMEGAQARTEFKGNLFSFSVPWQDIEKCCAAAMADAPALQRAEMERIREKLRLPHGEEILASLLNVHVTGGTKDLAEHLEGATMRPEVVTSLINKLRQSGYPGYEETGINSREAVEARMVDLYTAKYGNRRFTPKAIEDAIEVAHRAWLRGPSLVQDKSATPAEPARSIGELNDTLRPMQIVGERTASSLWTVPDHRHPDREYDAQPVPTAVYWHGVPVYIAFCCWRVRHPWAGAMAAPGLLRG